MVFSSLRKIFDLSGEDHAVYVRHYAAAVPGQQQCSYCYLFPQVESCGPYHHWNHKLKVLQPPLAFLRNKRNNAMALMECVAAT